MTEKLKGLWGRIKEWFQKLSKKTRILLFGSLIVLLLVILATVLILNNKPYAVLFTDVSTEDANAIVAYLEENGVTQYRLENSNTITVPSGMEAQLKAKILMQGYPKSGFAYETYRSAVGTMSTESDRNIAYLQDLQDRMSAVIRCFDGVKDAVVTIVQEEDRRYILDSDSMSSASASVVVTMDGAGSMLTKQQSTAIQNLLARSVKGLSIDKVSLSDTQGNIYQGGNSDSVASSDASALKLELEQQTKDNVRQQVLEVLTPFYGAQNIKVTVNATVDVSRRVGESTTFSQPDWAGENTGGKGIIGSQIYDQEVVNDDGTAAGGVAGAQANSDVNTYMENGVPINGGETYLKNKGETKFENDVTKEQTERMAGVLTDLTVAVTLNSEVATGMSRNQLLDHIARASGIGPEVQADKISVVSASFYENQATGNQPGSNTLPFQPWVLYAAAGGLLLLLVLLTLILVLRRKKKQRLSAELNALLDSQDAADAVTAEPSGVDIMTIKTEKSMELRKTIRQFAEENPEIAAYMLKSWLKEEDEQHA